MLENNSLLKSDEEQAKPLSYRIGWIFGSVSVFLLLVCLGFLTPQGRKIRAKLYFRGTTEEQINSQVLSLVAQTPVARADTLRKLVEKSGSKLSSIDRLRVRYLLATDLLSQGQGKAALEYLTALEQDYPLLAPYIMFRQAQAYKQMEQAEKVSKIREQLMSTYPNSTVIPDVLALTADNKAQFTSLLLKQFPYHPQTKALLRQKIAQNPNNGNCCYYW